MGEHSIFFYLLIGVLGIGILQALAIGGLFFLKRSGGKRANWFYGLLLITFGLTLLHNVLVMLGVYEEHKGLSFLPIYYTLAFPTLLFFHVKLTLYPSYKLRWTDFKHFILPVGQFIFFFTVFWTAIEYKESLGRRFYNPFYGAFEQALYLSTFFMYMYFSYRYLKQKRKQIRTPKEAKRIFYLDKLLQVLFILFCVHAIFVIGDFVSYEFLGINLRIVKPYVALGALSFAALIYWLGIYGFQVLFWGRKIFSR